MFDRWPRGEIVAVFAQVLPRARDRVWGHAHCQYQRLTRHRPDTLVTAKVIKVDLWQNNEITPTISASQDEDIGQGRGLGCHELLQSNLYLRGVSASTLVWLTGRCLHLNPRQASACVFDNEQVVAAIDLRHSNVVATKLEFRHNRRLSRTSGVEVLHSRHVK